MEREFRGIWVPAVLWLDNNFSVMEKVVLCEIDSYDREFGCIASNKTLSKNLNINPKTVGGIIKSLSEKDAIWLSYEDMNNYSGRKICVTYRPLLILRPPSRNQEAVDINQEGVLEKSEPYSNTFSETSSKKKKDKKEISFIKPSLEEVEQFLKEKGFDKVLAKKIHDHYELGDWKDAGGRQVVNWKQKINTNWLSNQSSQAYRIKEDDLFSGNKSSGPKMVY